MELNLNEQNSNEEFSLRDIWELVVQNIWLYVACCAVALCAAVAYILVTPPEYERTATVLLKSDDKGTSMSTSMTQGFEDLGLFKSNVNIYNEVEVFKTTKSMIEVVNRLGLESVYKQKQNNLRWVDLYKKSPFKVVSDSTMANLSFQFKLRFINPKEYQISDMVVYFLDGNKVELEEQFSGSINSSVTTPYGSFRVEATPFYDAEGVQENLFSFSRGSAKGVAKGILGRLSVALQDKNSSIIQIVLTDENPERANNIINTLISVYNENWIKDKNELTFSTSGFIDERLVVIEKELEKVDGSIATFKSDKLMPDAAAVAGIQLSQTTKNKEEQLVVRNQLSMAQYIQGYLKSPSVSDQLLPANTGIESAPIEGQIAKYNELLLQRNLLLANSSENNPLVADMTTNLRAIKGVIKASIDDLISTLTINLANLQSQENLNRENLSSTPKQAKELLGVERQQKIKEQLFLYLLQKREENELTQAFSAYNTRVLNDADGGAHPIAPKKAMVLLIALVVGIALPSAYIYAKTLFDTTIKDKSDLDGMRVPFLGFIPQVGEDTLRRGVRAYFRRKKIDHALHDTDNIVVKDGSQNEVNEAFRVLRTNLDFMVDAQKRGAKVVQLISLVPNSGKSFISANLSLSVALRDSKVLVIDGDIRKKNLSKYMGVNNSLGISDYLGGKESNIDKLIVKSTLSANLDILPVGAVPPNPSELLLKSRFAELLNQMCERYDYIFIDCPPVEMVPDATIIGKYCDASIFVVRVSNMDKRLLPVVDSIFEEKKFNNMSVLLNGVQHATSGYYGRYGRYGYRYGYGYGHYGYHTSDKEKNS